jgi:integrase
MLRDRGYSGGVFPVRRFVARLRPTHYEAFLRLSVLPGEQAQVDWASFGSILVGRAKRALSCFLMVLSWCRALFHTGARAGEQLALEWGDLDFANGFVSFRRSRTDGIVRDSTKSGKPRKVPLTASLIAALKAIRHLKGPIVFCREDGKPYSLWQLHERLWGACRRAELRKIRWHDTRHSFASQLVILGTPLRQVQE